MRVEVSRNFVENLENGLNIIFIEKSGENLIVFAKVVKLIAGEDIEISDNLKNLFNDLNEVALILIIFRKFIHDSVPFGQLVANKNADV